MQTVIRSLAFGVGLAVLPLLSVQAFSAEKISLTLTAPKKGMCSVKIVGQVPVELDWRYFYVAGRYEYPLYGKARSQDFAERFNLYKDGKRLRAVSKHIPAWVPSCRNVRMFITEVGCKPPSGRSVLCIGDVVFKDRSGLRVSFGQ